MIGFIKRRPIVVCTLLAFLITYPIGLAAMFALSPLQAKMPEWVAEGVLTDAVSHWGPTIAGLIVVAAVAGKAGFGLWVRQLFRWRLSLGYYTLALGFAIFVYVASLLLIIAVADIDVGAGAAPSATLGETLRIYGEKLVYITLTNGEETGWRFALLPLLLARYRLITATLFVGVIWAFWHFPIYLLSDDLTLAMFVPFLVYAVALSAIMNWMYVATRSLLLMLLMHGAINATTYTFEELWVPLSERIIGLGAGPEWAYAACASLTVIALLVARRRTFFARAPIIPEIETWVPRRLN